MTVKEIVSGLIEILRDSSVEDRDWEAVNADTTFESLGIDSLAILDMLYDVEQEFGIQLEAPDVVDLKSVGEIAALLNERGA